MANENESSVVNRACFLLQAFAGNNKGNQKKPSKYHRDWVRNCNLIWKYSSKLKHCQPNEFEAKTSQYCNIQGEDTFPVGSVFLSHSHLLNSLACSIDQTQQCLQQIHVCTQVFSESLSIQTYSNNCCLKVSIRSWSRV